MATCIVSLWGSAIDGFCANVEEVNISVSWNGQQMPLERAKLNFYRFSNHVSGLLSAGWTLASHVTVSARDGDAVHTFIFTHSLKSVLLAPEFFR